MSFAARSIPLYGSDPYPNASVALDFVRGYFKAPGASGGSLSAIPGWTYSRTGTEYASTSSGLLVPFGSGVPAVTDLGLQVWEARTNACLQSQTFDNATWAKASVTVTADTAVAPDGTTTADTIAISAGTNNTSQAATLTAATYTISVWAKTASGTAQFRLNYFNGTSSQTSSDFTATTTWQRFSYQVTGAAAVGNVALLSPSSAAATTFFAWGYQAELGSFASPYISTTSASATRAAGSASVGVTLPAEATIYTEYYAPPLTSTAPSRQYLWSVADTGNSRLTVRSADSANPQPTFTVGDGTATSGMDPVSTTAGQLVKTAASYSSLSAQAGFAVNGTDSTAARKYDPAQIGAKTLYIGQSEAQANVGDVIIRRMVVYPAFFSSAQRVALTS